MSLYRATASGVFASGLSWSFRWHLTSGASLATVVADWHAGIDSAWTDATHGLQTLYPTGTVLNKTSVAQLDPTTYREGAKTLTTETLPGTDTADSLPEGNAVLVSLRAGDVGRKNRGRTRLPAPGEDTAIGGLLTVPNATRVSTAMQALRTGLGSAGHQLYIYNSKVSAHDLVLFTPKLIVTIEADRVLRSLRARNRERAAIYV